MSDIQVPLVSETKSKKAELMNWALYISLFLSLIATLISIAGYFKKVCRLLSPSSLLFSSSSLVSLPDHLARHSNSPL